MPWLLCHVHNFEVNIKELHSRIVQVSQKIWMNRNHSAGKGSSADIEPFLPSGTELISGWETGTYFLKCVSVGRDDFSIGKVGVRQGVLVSQALDCTKGNLSGWIKNHCLFYLIYLRLTHPCLCLLVVPTAHASLSQLEKSIWSQLTLFYLRHSNLKVY